MINYLFLRQFLSKKSVFLAPFFATACKIVFFTPIPKQAEHEIQFWVVWGGCLWLGGGAGGEIIVGRSHNTRFS